MENAKNYQILSVAMTKIIQLFYNHAGDVKIKLKACLCLI
jgi:hypothetical protein